MIEIPEEWSQCEITKMSKRTRELVEAVMLEAGFEAEKLSEDSVKVTFKQGGDVAAFKRIADIVTFPEVGSCAELKFTTPDISN